MRKHFAVLLPFALTAVMIFTVVGQTSCSKSQLVTSAKDVLSVLTQEQANLAVLLPGLTDQISQAIVDAGKLVTAVESSDKTGALALVASIAPVINQVAADLGANKTELALLSIADVALAFIANQLPTPKPGAAVSADMVTVIQFKARPVWGCQYVKDKRCHQ